MQEEKKEQMKTGTTTVGLQYEEGVVLATERRASMGYRVQSKNSKKIYNINKNLAITTAGSVGDTQSIVRYLKAETNIFKYQKDRKMSPTSAATILANILQNSKMLPYLGMFLLGGYDHKEEKGRVYCIDPSGGVLEEDKYYSTGSGGSMAYGVLDDRYEDDMSEEEAIKVALRCIESARKRDIASGDGFSVTVVNEDGCRSLDDDEINEYRS